MRKPPALETILGKRLCLGCGACAYLASAHRAAMEDYQSVGRRPSFPAEVPEAVKREIASICPGARIGSRLPPEGAAAMSEDEMLVGPNLGVWEGWAADRETRFEASSGGIVSALACYCLEKLGMALVVQTGMSASRPWLNETVISRTREEVLRNSGSRYSPSSPVEGVAAIEASDRPCVFIGKPCDAAAVEALRKVRPALDRNLGLVLSFFCAGTPATSATLQVAESLGARVASSITSLRYRGRGWPGLFTVRFDDREASLTYDESWGMLSQKTRQLRCHLCPDGLGEMSDVSSGDAWHRKSEGTDGISFIIARTDRGREIVERAMRDGWLSAVPSSPETVVRAQNLAQRRRLVGPRIAGLRLLGLPVPEFPGFALKRASAGLPIGRRLKETLGMARRAVLRGYFKPEPRE
jgi:coenzyme F420 hydrogenase subunit beta